MLAIKTEQRVKGDNERVFQMGNLLVLRGCARSGSDIAGKPPQRIASLHFVVVALGA